jgi:hypothetical protein
MSGKGCTATWNYTKSKRLEKNFRSGNIANISLFQTSSFTSNILRFSIIFAAIL